MKEHVYGHQDDLKRPLTQLEAFNCRMDEEVKDIAIARIHGGVLHNLYLVPPSLVKDLLLVVTI